MRAVVSREYGPPEVHKLADEDKPVTKANEIMVRVSATAVTSGDWRMRKAEPFAARLVADL